jgi:hypothetical protein
VRIDISRVSIWKAKRKIFSTKDEKSKRKVLWHNMLDMMSSVGLRQKKSLMAGDEAWIVGTLTMAGCRLKIKKISYEFEAENLIEKEDMIGVFLAHRFPSSACYQV